MLTNIRLITCAYCGDIADTRDHVIPVSYLRYQPRSKSRYRSGDWTVPCCHDCNVHLGNKLLVTVPDRANYLLTHFERKWRKVLNSPYWGNDELSDLTGSLAQYVTSQRELQRFYYQRLSHLDLIASMPDDYLAP